jgi:hypothetical protein
MDLAMRNLLVNTARGIVGMSSSQRRNRMNNGISGYNSPKSDLYQCNVCGGWFSAGHFCVGKNENTPPSDKEVIQSLKKELEELKEQNRILREGLNEVSSYSSVARRALKEAEEGK